MEPGEMLDIAKELRGMVELATTFEELKTMIALFAKGLEEDAREEDAIDDNGDVWK